MNKRKSIASLFSVEQADCSLVHYNHTHKKHELETDFDEGSLPDPSLRDD
jgi:hypothetical protein